MNPMSVSISTMTMPQLIGVLKDLKGGSIGFDVFRNPETKTKGQLLQYILKNFTNDAIIPAVQRVASGTETPVLEEIPAVHHKAPAASPNPDDAAALAAILARMSGGASVNEAQVKAIVDAAFAAKEKALDDKIEAVSAPTRVVIENKATGEVKDCGLQHHEFPTLLASCNSKLANGMRMNVWLVGPAGTGKTTAAHNVADALGLKFYSNGSLLTEHSVVGYKDAGGNYHRTVFRDAFEHGGVYLADEFDGWNPSAVLCLNAATANGWMSFPDGMVKRHPDCIIILAANTWGQGATAEYVGRIKQDAATLDRMVFIEWGIDEKLEMAFAPNAAWTSKVQKFRQRVKDRGVKGHLVTPRASLFGAALLAQGLAEEKVMRMVLKKGLSDDTWNTVKV